MQAASGRTSSSPLSHATGWSSNIPERSFLSLIRHCFFTNGHTSHDRPTAGEVMEMLAMLYLSQQCAFGV